MGTLITYAFIAFVALGSVVYFKVQEKNNQPKQNNNDTLKSVRQYSAGGRIWFNDADEDYDYIGVSFCGTLEQIRQEMQKT